MKLTPPVRKKARIEMLPLIDIVFLLLVFFIYAMLSMAVHRGLPVDLPSSKSAVADERDLLSITIKADGAIFVDERPVPLAELPALLAVLSGGDTEKGVLLFADKALAYDTLFQVLEKVQSVGLTRISLQAEAEAGQ